ncbi:penicillin acylase family protein [Lichenifustis flavocetrariae]|uniref:Penicillin acylase family protein n=1 Tax=Lichenifustis flavocetrariae TaxID=2949735 RepID=A0AA41Z512_9HYPH|nr:penicillin acylase family protein [Lichenifustis flavocetrariae]MCW6510598.1 penicillin acylase family protein [Lichenifustis flavocetrariae]
MHHEDIAVLGLSEPVAITVDTWGIPHIRAGNLLDLFFAQGFNAARDRLWQIDLWRKRGLGLLAADFGPGYLEQDRAARLFLYRGDMEAEWACYCSDAKVICDAFVNGINAYVDLVDAEPKRLPPEFVELGTRPAKWAADDVVRIRSHSWMRNALSEVIRANVMAQAGAEADLLRQTLNPPITPTIPEGLDLGSIPTAVLDIFKLALVPVTFGRERLDTDLDKAEAWRKVTPLGEVVREANGQGSNNWVIAGTNTETGRPILANDPHRAHAAPSLRYLVHLTCPEFDGIGAGEPILPGIMMGHNGTIAFGLTLFFGPDEEDVYVYETAPDDPELYRYDDGWERMTRIEEPATVRGAPGQTLALKFTRHGPVIFEDPTKRRAYAVRSVWFEPGAAPYFVSLSSMRAKTHADFAEDMKRWAVPAVNQVYADTGGTIAWIAAGTSPIRTNWEGLLPVPGDGRYEWQGFYRAGDLPHVLNPETGFFATANEQNVPVDWSLPAEKIGHEWIEGARANRIAEVFAATPVHSVRTSCALQTDLLSLPARRVVRLLADLGSEDAAISTALDLLRDWDAVLAADSAAAALFEVWWSKHLRPGVLAMAVADPATRALLGAGDPDGVLPRLEQPGPWFAAPAEAARDALLLGTLSRAYSECAEHMGLDPSAWAWGRLHQGYFEHVLTGLTRSPDLNVGPLPMGGSDSTPMNAMYRFNDFRVILGASVRMVVDVGAWDESVCINAPGQSGDPRSPHYGDLAGKWSKGEYVPMLYSQEAVSTAAQMQLCLRPSARYTDAAKP